MSTWSDAGNYNSGASNVIENQRNFYLMLQPIRRTAEELQECARSITKYAELLNDGTPFINSDEMRRIKNPRYTNAWHCQSNVSQ